MKINFNLLKISGLVLLAFILVFGSYFKVYADEVEEIQKQIDDLRRQREMSEAATAPLAAQLDTLEKKINDATARINKLAQSIDQKQKELNQLEAGISKKEDDLEFEQLIFEKTVRSLYIRNRTVLPLAIVIGGSNVDQTLREIGYRNAVSAADRDIIVEISAEIKDLNQKRQQAAEIKTSLESQKSSLSSLRAQIDKEAEYFRQEVGKARAFQNQLNIEIAKLTARQQEILAAKFGTFTTSVGDVPLADDFNASPAFNPGFSPAFAAFSFGAFTHRNGMSQYGALGRAKSGQNAESILQAYYPGATLNKNYSVPATIDVQGYGTMPFEDQYLKRIYEVPNSWPLEVLKAQAIAARTYAIRSSKPICTTQACQVYQNSNKGGAWEQAVGETRGWVLEGGPSAQYSSTSGGYLNTSGWDTNCGSFSCWTAGAYEKIASSPWFYKAWYTESYLNSSNKCGRSHPWLTNDEFTDILNSWVVYKNGTQAEKDRISPVSCWSGNPFSISEMRDRANGYGGAYTSVSSISVSQGTSGSTASVSLQTNKGSLNISGSDFKTIFNLRAPGFIAIRSPLFNIERK